MTITIKTVRPWRSLGIAVAALVLAGAPSVSIAQAGEDDPVSANPSGQDASREEKPYWRQNLFRRFGSDQKFLFKSWLPSELHRPGFTWPILLGTTFALTTSRDSDASQLDLRIERNFSSDTRGRTEVAASHVFTTLGDGTTGALLIGTAYLAGRWSGHDHFAETASLSAQAVLDAGLWVTILKGVTARTRPSGGATGNFFDYHPADGQQIGSFPSGHATGAFAAATVFAGMYRDHRWVPWVAYGTASLVGVSRVALGRHFPSDVFVGAVVGNSFGRMVLERREEESPSATSTLQPFFDPARKEAGVVWTRQW